MRFLLAACLAVVAVPAAAIELALPLQCTVGVDCAVQHYFDRDPGPDRMDYRCGHQTYDGHDGIDIRVPTLRAMRTGVAVLAAADGVVAALRDAMPDQMLTDANAASVKDRECGNGVAIEHAGGWTTQYCHMKLGSIVVKKGDLVTTGTRLGEVGLSGETQFPHLHFDVRKDDVDIDPFAIEPAASGAACSYAGDDASGVWSPAAKAALVYRPAFVLNAGFSNGTVTMDQVESGELADIRIAADSPAMVFYGRAIGIEAGDRQRLVVTGPDGRALVTDETDPTDRPKAQLFAFAGKKLTAARWPPGTYRGRYSIIRSGAEIAAREAEIVIP